MQDSSATHTARSAAPKSHVGLVLRLVGTFLGAALLFVLAQRLDWAQLRIAFQQLGKFTPALIACEVGRIGSESIATWYALRKPDIPRSALFRAVWLGYAWGAVMPLPRPAAETAKASVLAPYVGASATAASGVVMQTAVLSAIGAACLFSALYIYPNQLSYALFGNTALLWTSSIALLLLARSSRICNWLGRRIPRFHKAILEVNEHHRGAEFSRATMFTFGSNALQFVGLGLLAGESSIGRLHAACLLGGTYLITGSAGVLIPGQVGARELAFAALAPVLGVDPATAVAYSLLPRAAQLTVAAAGLLVGQFGKPTRLRPAQPA
jgi:uncharacterized membrane protein YbhN (UPF0104 family)